MHVVGMNATVSFFYILLRDHLPAGTVEKIMRNHLQKALGKKVVYSNRILESLAIEYACRLRQLNEPNKKNKD